MTDTPVREDDECLPRLDSAFEAALRPLRESSDPVTVLFSGGVDSSVLALALRAHPQLELLTVGVPGCRDAAAARSAAEALGLRSTFAEVGPSDLSRVADRYALELEGAYGPGRAVAVGLALALERSAYRSVVAAQGVDEVFLGYHHFRNLDETAARARVEQDLAALEQVEWPRAIAVARAASREVSAPFLDPRWLAVAASIPIARRLPGPLGKEFFRAWARHRSLPAEIADRPKRAFQYGSGIHRLLGGR